MVKKNLFCIFLASIISSGIAHGSDYANLNENEPRCCYREREDDPLCQRIACRTRSCECYVHTCCASTVCALTCVATIAIVVAGAVNGTLTLPSDSPNPHNNLASSTAQLFLSQASKPVVTAMERDSSFLKLQNASNSTHIASLLKRNNKKKQS